MLKKVVINFFVTIELIMALMIIFAGVANAAPVGQYTRVGYIEDVDREGGFTVLVDECNQVWWWDEVTFQTPEGPELLRSGYKVVIQIDGRGTRRRKDDVVIDFEVYDR